MACHVVEEVVSVEEEEVLTEAEVGVVVLSTVELVVAEEAAVAVVFA